MNLLFWLILFAMAAAIGSQWWVQRKHKGQDPEAIPAPVLSFTKRSRWPLPRGSWSVDEIDFLATADRIRAVVTLHVDADQQEKCQQAMQIMAREIYAQTKAEAVLIEAFCQTSEPSLYLFAADGRGWWGRELISTAHRAGNS